MCFISNIYDNGGSVYIVGGANRDRLINQYHQRDIIIKDYDLVVCGIEINLLENILKQYGNVKLVGKSFGVLIFSYNGNNIDVVLPRIEISTGYGHRDFHISFDKTLLIQDDLRRRDSPINSIALQIFSVDELYIKYIDESKLIDLYEGITDIKNKIWRGNKFSEDPIRIMRAIRQCSQMGFELDKLTKDLIIKESNLLGTIKQNSLNRITQEFIKILDSDHCVKWLKFIFDTDIYKYIGFNHINTDEINRYIQFAVDNNYNLVVKIVVILISMSSIYEIKLWLNMFILTSTKFNNDYLPLILLCKRHINKLDTVINDVHMRHVIHCVGEKFMTHFIQIYECINQRKTPWLKLLFINNIDFMRHYTPVLNGTDIINLFNIKGKKIGKLKKWLSNGIIENKVSNKKDDLIEYIKSNYNF